MTNWRPVQVAVIGWLVFAGIIVVLTHVVQGPTSTPQPGPFYDAAPFHCPRPGAAARMTRDGGPVLPAGAVAVRLCRHDNHDPWRPPHDVLIAHVDDLVRLVNTQEVHDPSSDDACGGVGAPAYVMVFRYPNGIRMIAGDDGGCWDLDVGGTQRLGSKAVFRGFVGRLAEQRRHELPPHRPPARLRCSARTGYATSPIFDPESLTHAIACRQGFTPPGDRSRGVPLTATRLRVLGHDLRTSYRRHDLRSRDRSCATSHRGAAVLVADAWGDRTAVLAECRHYQLVRSTGPRPAWVRELPATRRLFARLAAVVDR